MMMNSCETPKPEDPSKSRKKQLHIYLPDAILINILQMLPLKSILRFQCVATSWQSLITHSSFKLHSNTTDNSYSIIRLSRNVYYLPNNRVYIGRIMRRFPIKDYANIANDASIGHIHDGIIVKEFPGYRVLGSSNGLICFTKNFRMYLTNLEPMYLWNPGINRYKKVPSRPPKLMHPCSESQSRREMIGFGFCGVKGFNDYKLVSICFHERETPRSQPPTYCRGHLNVYSLTLDSWRSIPSVNVPNCLVVHLHHSGSYAFIGGVYYWLINNIHHRVASLRSDSFSIVAFDLINETFLNNVELPKPFQNSDYHKLYLFELNGSLALYEDKYRKDGCLWVLRHNNGGQETWVELFSVRATNIEELLKDERLPYAVKIMLDQDQIMSQIDIKGKVFPSEYMSYDGTYIQSLALLGVAGGINGFPYHEEMMVRPDLWFPFPNHLFQYI